MTSYLTSNDVIFLLSRRLNDENVTNAVKHRMHSIRVLTAKRLVYKRPIG